ncbi:MAG: DNA/RNA nuclease SfsA [Candidatus Methanofastidiosa archaeon]|nr:DNA/RNA nuclease SfsA [Candidatus Methanofastidiosa archaeon]
MARFISRKNRFLGVVETTSGERALAHIHDPGRLSEVLTPRNLMLIKRASQKRGRKTEWDIIAGLVDGRWTLINSSYHRKLSDWVLARGLLPFMAEGDRIIPEIRYGRSRLDYLIENGKRRMWLEVKGCSLSRDGVALFPDAPTARGRRHVVDLTSIAGSGDQAAILFLVFAPNARSFSPNFLTDPEFSDRLLEAREAGVGIFPLSFSYDSSTIFYEGAIPFFTECTLDL